MKIKFARLTFARLTAAMERVKLINGCATFSERRRVFMKSRSCLMIAFLMFALWAPSSIAQCEGSSCAPAQTAHHVEFLVQFKGSTTEADRNRVLTEYRGKVLRRIDSPARRAAGLSELDLMAVPVVTNATDTQIEALRKRIERDKAVLSAEYNPSFGAASQSGSRD